MTDAKRDHNLASMVQAILALPIEERVTSASVDGETYRFTTERTYEADCYGHRPDRVDFTNGLKVWHAIDMIHGIHHSQKVEE